MYLNRDSGNNLAKSETVNLGNMSLEIFGVGCL